MGNTLWTYGCSWTYYGDHKEKFNLKFWPEYLAEMLDKNLINTAKGGESISESTIKLFRNLGDIKKGDVVVFEFTYPDRFSIPHVNVKNNRKTWSAKNIFDLDDVLINYSFHSIEYFKNENFCTNEKIENYLNFVINFRTEILMFGIKNILPIFDYIENHIGAKVKYWFIDFSQHLYENKEIHKNIITTLWDHERTVVFPIDRFNVYPYEYNIEAGQMIRLNKLRYSDTYLNYDKKHQDSLITDYHPNEGGQKLLAECIFKSFTLELPETFNEIKLNPPII